MNFKEAYQKMLEGKKVKRKGRSLCCFYDSNENKFCTGDGVTITGIVFEAALAEDWEVVEERTVVEETKSKVWKPSAGELYYYINSKGEIKFSYYNNRSTKDKRRICNIGNYFKTDEEADHMVEKLKVIKELQDFALEHNNEEIDWVDNEQDKWAICYDIEDKEIAYESGKKIKSVPFNVYFATEQDCERAIKTIGEDNLKKYYFDVED